MEEIGKVVETEGDLARVEFTPKGGCSHCPVKAVCHPEANKMYTEALCPEGVKVGDIVKIDMNPKSSTIAALLVFILPIVAFIIGFVITQSFIRNQNFGILGGILLVVVCFLFLGKLDKKFSKGRQFKPVVKQIISSGGSTC